MFDLQRKTDLGLTPSKQLDVNRRLRWNLAEYQRIIRNERLERNPASASRRELSNSMRRKYYANLYAAGNIPHSVWKKVTSRGVCEDCNTVEGPFLAGFRIPPTYWGTRRLNNLKCVCDACYEGVFDMPLTKEVLGSFEQFVSDVSP